MSLPESFADALRLWLVERPTCVQQLALEWPPLCKVTSDVGRPLMFPAPGIVGRVNSYMENGHLGVVAPAAQTVTSPITGVTISEGQEICGECDPRDLVFLEFDVVTRDDVAEALRPR